MAVGNHCHTDGRRAQLRKVTYLKYRVEMPYTCTETDRFMVTNAIETALKKLRAPRSEGGEGIGIIGWKSHQTDAYIDDTTGNPHSRPLGLYGSHVVPSAVAFRLSAFEPGETVHITAPLKPGRSQREWLTEERIHSVDAALTASKDLAQLSTSEGPVTCISPPCRIGGTLLCKEVWRPVVENYSSFIEYKAGNGTMTANVLNNATAAMKLALRFPGAKQSRHSEAWHPAASMPKWACRLRFEVTDLAVTRLNDRWYWSISAKRLPNE